MITPAFSPGFSVSSCRPAARPYEKSMPEPPDEVSEPALPQVSTRADGYARPDAPGRFLHPGRQQQFLAS